MPIIQTSANLRAMRLSLEHITLVKLAELEKFTIKLQAPPVPDVDRDNVEFVIFMRAAKVQLFNSAHWRKKLLTKAGAQGTQLSRESILTGPV